MIDAVLFDWGGTLTPYHDVDVLGCWAAAARVIAPDRLDEVAAALLAAEEDAWVRTTDTLVSTTTEQLLRSASKAAGVEVDAGVFERATQAYRTEWSPHFAARPESAGVLSALRGRGLRTGMLSNTHWPRQWHEDALAEDGLLELLDARFYTSELTYVKPHPTTFAALLDAIDTTADRAVFVGDRPYDDISGAQALGMRTVWIRNDFVPRYDVEPDATIDELDELVGIVDGWR